MDILWASPECTHHSAARRGGNPINDQSRATTWCVTRWADQIRPKIIMVENVPEFRSRAHSEAMARRSPVARVKPFRCGFRRSERSATKSTSGSFAQRTTDHRRSGIQRGSQARLAAPPPVYPLPGAGSKSCDPSSAPEIPGILALSQARAARSRMNLLITVLIKCRLPMIPSMITFVCTAVSKKRWHLNLWLQKNHRYHRSRVGVSRQRDH